MLAIVLFFRTLSWNLTVRKIKRDNWEEDKKIKFTKYYTKKLTKFIYKRIFLKMQLYLLYFIYLFINNYKKTEKYDCVREK